MITDLLCTGTTEQLNAVKVTYEALYNESLRSRITSESKAALRATYYHMIDGKRDVGGDILIETHVTTLRNDPHQCVALLAGHQREHAEKIAEGFIKLTGVPFSDYNDSKNDGHEKYAFEVITTPLVEYYGEKLLKAFKVGTHVYIGNYSVTLNVYI